MNIFSRLRFLLFCLAPALALGCTGPERPAGTVAEVNGVPIGFQELEAARNAVFSGPSGLQNVPGDEELRRQYVWVLRQIIMQELAAQELERLKKPVDPSEVGRLEAEIRGDYPPGAYEEMLEEQGLDADSVRLMLRRRLDMEQYVARVLRPEIGITSEEVQAYFEAHKKDFLIPEQWHYLQVTAPDKAGAEAVGKALAAGTPPAEAGGGFSGGLREVRAARDSLPDDVRAALERLAPGTAGPAVRADGAWRVLVRLETVPETLLDPGTVAARVEAALLEEKAPQAVQRALERRLEKAKVFIAEPLLRRAAEPGLPDPPEGRGEGASAQPGVPGAEGGDPESGPAAPEGEPAPPQ